MLYRATRDGNSAESFHRKCDNIGGTLTIVKTNKGMRFGGYTEKTWNGNDEAKKDENNNGFCYSLDLFKIYNITKEAKSTINCRKNEGPRFYGGDCSMFGINFPIEKDNSFTNYTTSEKSFGKFEKNYEISNCDNYFSLQELEIFRILYD